MSSFFEEFFTFENEYLLSHISFVKRKADTQVADTQRKTNMAANLAVIDYDRENLDPILSVEEAFERSSFFEAPSSLYPEQVGDFSKGMAEADHQIRYAEINSDSAGVEYDEEFNACSLDLLSKLTEALGSGIESLVLALSSAFARRAHQASPSLCPNLFFFVSWTEMDIAFGLYEKFLFIVKFM